MRLREYRRFSQVVFTIVTLGGLLGIATTGFIYPYFFCYSNPWDVGACPIGILEHGVIEVQIDFVTGAAMLLFLFGFLSLMGILFGRGFCGWACPMGLLQDITKKLGISKRVSNKLKVDIDPRTKYLKYLILLAIPVMSYKTMDLAYTRLCPVGGVTGTVPTLAFFYDDWLPSSGFPVKLLSIILFSLLILLVTRGWCKYLCPVGAYLAPWNRVSAVRVTRDEETCTNCNLCEPACPMDVKEIGRKTDMECVLCGRCVEACKFGSLKLGPRFSTKRLEGIAPFAIIIIVAFTMLLAGTFAGGYARTDAINGIPCLGCLALDPVSPDEWNVADFDQPDFVLANLTDGPVFLHYRTDVCAACDDMEPYIEELEIEHTDVSFVHINLDHATEAEDDSYDLYDILGEPGKRYGVPMFTVITLDLNDSQVMPFFKTQYGSSSDGGVSKQAALDDMINDALVLHARHGGVPIAATEKLPLVELFVDTNCVNCPDSEEALVHLMEEEEECILLTYVTDATGISGTQAWDREWYYQTDLSAGGGHPWAVFSAGQEERMGALNYNTILANYRSDISGLTFDPLNLSISGSMASMGDELLTNITLSNALNASVSVRTEVFLVELKSRWNNREGDAIPYAVVDIMANRTVDVQGSRTLSIFWNGTDAYDFTDFRLSNIAIVVAVWHDDFMVTSDIIRSGVPELIHLSSGGQLALAEPDGSATLDFTLYNYGDSAMQANLTVEEANYKWTAALSTYDLTVPAGSNASFTMDISGAGTTWGETFRFRVKAQDVTEPTLFDIATQWVEVRTEINPPVLLNPGHSPELPRADESVRISVTVGEDSGISSVKVSYFSCTPEWCSAYFDVNMSVEGNEYVADVMPIAADHTDLHYRIIAEDIYGNVNETEMFDVELEPVGGGDGDGIPFSTKGMAMLIVFTIIAIGVVAEASVRKK